MMDLMQTINRNETIDFTNAHINLQSMRQVLICTCDSLHIISKLTKLSLTDSN